VRPRDHRSLAFEFFQSSALALPAPPPRARAKDPAPSHLAAARVEEFADDHHSRIHKALETPGTIYDIAERTGLDAVQIARRLPEMKGRARRSLETKLGPKGRPCGVWTRE
jgi:hypothetical protein